MYSKLLITGGSGWLGRGLINFLKHGMPEVEKLKDIPFQIPIKTMVLPSETEQFKLNYPDVEVCEGDLKNPNDCKLFVKNEADACIFHLAGIIHPSLKVREFYDTNVQGTKNLVNASIEENIKRVIVMSSNSPIGCNPNNKHRFNEMSPYNPYLNYGKSKKLLEDYINNINDKIEAVIIRAPWFYGPFQPKRQLEFFEMIKNGKGPIVGNGNNVRSMVYIDNLVQGLILSAIEKKAAGKTYWIADEKAYSMNQILNTIERLMSDEFNQKCRFTRLKLPSFVSDFALVIDKIIQFAGFYNQKIHVLSEMNKNIACSVNKAKDELGYKPSISLEEGMRRSLHDFYG